MKREVLPGFWPHPKSKKPGFLQFFGGVSMFLEKTRFLATPKIAKIKQRPNLKGDYCERFYHRADFEIGIWARRCG
jgi:hypothetical protein